jgi:hypothetical protein
VEDDDGPNQGKVKQRFAKREGLNRRTSSWLAGRRTLDRLGGLWRLIYEWVCPDIIWEVKVLPSESITSINATPRSVSNILER